MSSEMFPGRHRYISARPSLILCLITLVSFPMTASTSLFIPTTVSAMVLLQRPFSLQSMCLARKLSLSPTPFSNTMLFNRCGGGISSSSPNLAASSRSSNTRLYSSASAPVPLSSPPPASSSTSTPSICGSASEIILSDGRALTLNFRPRSWFSRLFAYSTAALLAVGRRKFLPFSPKFRWHFKALEKVAHPRLAGGLFMVLFVLMEAYVYMIPLRQVQLQSFFLPEVVPAEKLGLPASRFMPVLRREKRNSSVGRLTPAAASDAAASSTSAFASPFAQSTAPASKPSQTSHLKLHALVHRHRPSLPPSSSPTNIFFVHCNHGFGANSLSYEPVLESLSSTLGQQFPTLAAAHDAPGFGLSESPAEMEDGGGQEEEGLYSFENNARLGGRLMAALGEEGGREERGEEQHVYIGHSMGSLTSAHMALNKLESQDEEARGREESLEKGRGTPSPPPPPVILILVAPAIMPMRRSPSRLPPTGQTFLPRLFPARLLRFIFSKTGPVAHSLLLVLTSFFLRSLCYSEKFWRDGLGVAWGVGGPPTSLTLAHYRLPSLKEGWERGLSRFLLAPLFAGRRNGGREGGKEGEERGLVKALAERVREGRLKVLIIHGTKDRVVAMENSRRLAIAMKEGGKGVVEVVEIEGVGHVPHEEVPGRFVETVVEFVKRGR